MSDCVCCDIVGGKAPATIVAEWTGAIAIVPRGPVTPGHVLVMPRTHVADAAENPAVTGYAAVRAAELARDRGGDFNLIVNCGPAASMTVPHLHWHVVPRQPGDGLLLPWTNQHRPAPTHLEGDSQ